MDLSSTTPILPNRNASSPEGGIPAPLQSNVRASLGTLTGIAHAINQDTVTHHPGHFSGVADGVGGGAHGEVASRLLMQQLSNGLPNNAVSAQAGLTSIDRHIAQVLSELGDGPGASVFAAAWPLDTQRQWQVLWVGDCQVTHYRWVAEGWQVAWQSPAQTYQTHLLAPPAGVAPDSPANMVGCGMSIAPGWHRMSVSARDRIVIASDGFHKAFTASEMLSLLEQVKAPLPLETAQQWCQLARQQGSQDDISVVILEIAPRPLIQRLVFGIAISICALMALLAWFTV